MVNIDSYEFGSIKIDGKTYHEDVIVSWDGEVREVRTAIRHVFGLPELQKVMEKKPELVIVGTGASGLCSVSDEIKKEVEMKGFKFMELVSKEAIKKFNEAVRQRKRVSAFVHLTC
ncbi:MAG: MTH938/NDUFAF3 family protein [Candidatus Aenigmarchaeota archaeon]|nr:MTH938/NDUFAF3 family protein [Candidatus Aenigmarchaeota archaeon]